MKLYRIKAGELFLILYQWNGVVIYNNFFYNNSIIFILCNSKFQAFDIIY